MCVPFRPDNGDERSKLLPASACDFTTGYFGAYGVLLALARRAREGGSYHVRVSLCRAGMYIYKQGHVNYAEADMGRTDAELDSIMIQSKGGHGARPNALVQGRFRAAGASLL